MAIKSIPAYLFSFILLLTGAVLPGFALSSAMLDTRHVSLDDGDSGLYYIPVVFHVLYHDSTENISTAQVQDGLNRLNLDFRKQNADTIEIIAPFKAFAADCDIEFRLAQLDPNGSACNGITRTYTDSSGFDIPWNQHYDSTGGKNAWPTDQYLNIWVVKRFGSIVAGGRGSLPSNSFTERQGIVITGNQVGSIGTGSGSRVLTHESGHYLGLYHLWGVLGIPGDSTNCLKDDSITDTPNCSGSSYYYGNPTGLWAYSCGSLDNVQNYMDYTPYPRMFTYGQADRMHQILNSSLGGRSNLHTTQNLIATGVLNPSSIHRPIPEEEVSIFPLPAREQLWVRIPGIVAEQVTLISIMGQPCRVDIVQSGEDQLIIQTAGLSPGTYILRIVRGDRILSRRILIAGN